ncbi:MAG: methyltransferase, partial [Verrucomicrobiota bacterium]
VKTNIGHMESAAGIGGLIKVILAMEHGYLPRHLHCDRPTSHVSWEDLPLQVTSEGSEWPESERRIAGVSSFGFSGTNAHLVVERPEASVPSQTDPPSLQVFQRRSHWVETGVQPVKLKLAHPWLGNHIDVAEDDNHFIEVSGQLFDDGVWKEHRVFDQPVLPAVGFIELMLAALRETQASTSRFQLSDLSFANVLALTSDSGPVQIVVGKGHCKVAGKDRGDRWKTLATAQWSSSMEDEAVARPTMKVTESVEPVRVYERLASQGVTYGDVWKVVERVEVGGGQINATLRSRLSLDGYLFHPIVLDACVQSVVALFLDDSRQTTVLPEGAGRVDAFVERLSGDCFSCQAKVRTGQNWVSADLTLTDHAGGVLLVIRDFRLRPVSDRWRDDLVSNGQESSEDWFYTIDWSLAQQPSVGLVSPPSVLSAALVPKFHEKLALPVNERYRNLLPRLEVLAGCYVGRIASQIDRATVVDSHREQAALLVAADGGSPENEATLEKELAPHFEREVRLLKRCIEETPSVLRGEQDPMSVLFPGGDTSDLSWLYEQSTGAQLLNGQMRAALEKVLVELGRPARVLEIGAGTGGTTSGVRPLIDQCECYVFTDVSPLLVHAAEKRFGDAGSMKFQTLDIEDEPASQGLEEGTFDVVVAANVLHATSDLKKAVNHVRRLLRPGGYLLLLEGTERLLWLDLIFGLTKGWWAFDDDDLRGHPLLSVEQWHGVLEGLGFASAAATTEGLPQSVILAQHRSL